jgi:hypothetical protein
MRKYNRRSIEQRVTRAVERLLKEDMALLERNVNERSVSHKLAEHFRRGFRHWHVDCEWSREKEPVDSTKARTVYPDIIVHHRGTDDSLLVVEIKIMENSSPQSDQEDRGKLRAFVGRPYNYQHGLFLRLSTSGEYGLEWFPRCESEPLSWR